MPNRFVCEVLAEIRTAVKVGRIDMVIGLVEEIQTMVNRMEAKLADYAGMGYTLDEARRVQKRLREISEKVSEIDDVL